MYTRWRVRRANVYVNNSLLYMFFLSVMFEEFHSDSKAHKEDEPKLTYTYWRMHYARRDSVLNCFYVLRISTTK